MNTIDIETISQDPFFRSFKFDIDVRAWKTGRSITCCHDDSVFQLSKRFRGSLELVYGGRPLYCELDVNIDAHIEPTIQKANKYQTVSEYMGYTAVVDTVTVDRDTFTLLGINADAEDIDELCLRIEQRAAINVRLYLRFAE